MPTKPAKVVGILSIIAGAVMLIAGAATWVTISTQLTEEKIVVPKDATFLPGASVSGPFSAYAQAEAIKMHSLKTSGGKTYAELGALAAKAKTDGDTALETKYNAQRTIVMNGSFLRASLFTSVVAYGVAALVIGSGAVFGLIGWALLRLTRPFSVAAPSVAGEEPSGQ